MKKFLKIYKKDIVMFAIPLLVSIFFLLVFFPGIMTIDGNYQWKEVQSGIIDNAHPFFSTYFMYLLSKIWNTHMSIIVFQNIIFSFLWTIICHKTRCYNYLSQLVITIVLCFTPLFAIFSITVWKDILYSYYLMMLAFLTYDKFKDNNNHLSKKIMFIFGLLIFLVFNYRHNGKIVALLYICYFVYMYFKSNKADDKKIKLTNVLVMILTFLTLNIALSVPKNYYLAKSAAKDDSIGIGSLNTYLVWSFGSYLQSTKIDVDDLKFLDGIMDTKYWKKQYYPMHINSTFYPDELDEEYLVKNQKEFRKIYFKYVKQKPLILIKHVLTADSLLFSIDSQDHGYVYSYAFYEWDRLGFSIEKNSKLPKFGTKYEKLINFSLNTPLKYFYQPGLILYFVIGLIIYLCIRKKMKSIYLLCIPMLLNTISLTPINLAQDLRYVYINYLTLLLIIIVVDGIKHQRENISISNNKKQKSFKKILLIVPAFNEEESILNTYNTIVEYNKKYKTKFDVIVINDGSTDRTEQILKENKINHIKLVHNLGIGGAVQTGYKYALENKYDIAIQYDGDGQHDVSYVKKIIEPIVNNEADFVIGSRFIEESKDNFNSTFSRRIGINMISFFINLVTDKKVYDTTSGFRAVNKEIIELFASDYPTEYPEPITTTNLLQNKYRLKEIPVKMNARVGGKSSIGSWKNAYYMINVLLSIVLLKKGRK